MKQTILIVLGALMLLSCKSNKQVERKENFTVKFGQADAYVSLDTTIAKKASWESEIRDLLKVTSDSTKNYVDSVGYNYILAKSRMFIPAEKGTWFVCPYKDEESKFVLCYKGDGENDKVSVYPAFISKAHASTDALLFVKYGSNDVYAIIEPFRTVGPFKIRDGKNYLVDVDLVSGCIRLKMDKSKNPDGTLKDESKSLPDFEYVLCAY